MSPRLMVTTGRVRRLLAVLVQPESGAGCVEVDDRRVRRVAGALLRAERVTDRVAGELDHVGRQRLDRRTVGVVGRAAVGVRLPVPAEAHRLHRHQVPGRHARVAQSGRRLGPPPEVVGERPLAARSSHPLMWTTSCEHLGGTGRRRVVAGEVEPELAGREGLPAVAAPSAPRRGGWCPSGCGARSSSHRVNAAASTDVRFSRRSSDASAQIAATRPIAAHQHAAGERRPLEGAPSSGARPAAARWPPRCRRTAPRRAPAPATPGGRRRGTRPQDGGRPDKPVAHVVGPSRSRAPRQRGHNVLTARVTRRGRRCRSGCTARGTRVAWSRSGRSGAWRR